MRFKTLMLAVAVAALAAPAATAEPGPGKGKAKPDRVAKKACKGNVSVVLKGTLTSDPTATDTSFTMKVTKSNRHGRAYVKAGTATLTVDAKTKVRRDEAKTLDSLAMNDNVLVQAKTCRSALKDGATPQLTARHVVARAAAPAPETPPTTGG